MRRLCSISLPGAEGSVVRRAVRSIIQIWIIVKGVHVHAWKSYTSNTHVRWILEDFTGLEQRNLHSGNIQGGRESGFLADCSSRLRSLESRSVTVLLPWPCLFDKDQGAASGARNNDKELVLLQSRLFSVKHKRENSRDSGERAVYMQK